MSKRFIISKDDIQVEENILKAHGEEVHHINVLRYKIGDNVYINEYEVEISKLLKDSLEGIIVGKMPKRGEPKTNITLIQSYLKSDKMDYVVQKAVELGAKQIIPTITKNTVVKLDEKDKIKKTERLNKIAKEAVEQCGRTDEVEVSEVMALKQIDFSKFNIVYICHETSEVKLKEKISEALKAKNIAVVIGPEGGLDESELKDILKLDNVVDVSLGQRVLRAETASLNILSILSYELE